MSRVIYDTYHAMDNTIRYIERLSAHFARATNRSVSTVSRLATGSGDTLSRLLNGGAITTRRANRAFQWFSDHWPSDLEWPCDIERPAPQKAAPQKAAPGESKPDTSSPGKDAA